MDREIAFLTFNVTKVCTFKPQEYSTSTSNHQTSFFKTFNLDHDRPRRAVTKLNETVTKQLTP